jgi:predicted MFS family arabinose efflux permease
MSGMLAPMGIISGPMAGYFAQPVTEITTRFSWLTMGILVGAVIAIFIFDWIRLKKLMLVVYSIIFASLVSIAFLEDLTYIGFALGLVGISCGIGLPAAALTISKTYETTRRASMLVITDSCFSVAGIFCSWFAIFLLAREYHWSGVYQFVALVAASIVALSAVSTFPETSTEETNARESAPWPVGVWLCLFALFLYTLGQWSILLWLPNYVETSLGVPSDQAGQLVSQFWTGMFAAQLFVAWWVMKIGARRLAVIAGMTTTLLSVPLWLYGEIEGLIILATIMGFANLGILKIILSFATQMVRIPTARLISSLLLGATMGTAIAPWVTSQIVTATSNHFILQFGTGCYVVMTVLLLLASREYLAKATT